MSDGRKGRNGQAEGRFAIIGPVSACTGHALVHLSKFVNRSERKGDCGAGTAVKRCDEI